MSSSPEPVQLAESTTSVLYRAAAESFMAVARTLTADQWATPVPCLPGWTVRDVLSHVSGIPDDAFAGRMEGVAGEAWTGSQVERNRAATVDELLARWAEQYGAFADVLDDIGEVRPPFDCHAHEHDVRHALGLAGNRDSVVIEAGSVTMACGFESSPFPVTVELDDGRSFTSGGAGGAGVIVGGLSRFELFRSRLGRRSRSQVEAYDWSGDPVLVAAAVDAWFSFGPSAVEIDE